MDSKTKAEITRLLKDLFSAFPSMGGSTDAARIYLQVLEPYSVAAISRSVHQFVEGRVEEHDGRFVPSAPVLARNVRAWQEAIDIIETAAEERAFLTMHGGILEADFGRGLVNMRKMTAEEKTRVLKSNGTDLPERLKIGNGGVTLPKLKRV